MAYSIQVFTKNYRTQRGTDGTHIRTLTHATRITVSRNLNAPESITFEVPRNSDDAAVIELARVVRVLDGTDVVATGVIVGHLDKTRSMIPVTASGKAEYLNWMIVPEDFEIEGDTAEAQVRELLKNYRFFRQNTPDNFNAGTLTNTEVFTIAGTGDEGDAYFVTLNETNEVYDTSGTYISQPILCTDGTLGDPTDFARLRYLAEVGNDTEITVAFRHSNNAANDAPDADADWSAWSSEFDLATVKTVELGITTYSISGNFRWIQARFSLSTSDTAITPALQAYEIVCEYPGEITAGNINLPGSKITQSFSLTSHHEILRQIVTARNAEFHVTDDYELNIAPRLGDTSPTVTFEVGANCNVVRYQQRDRRLSTEIWSFGRQGEGLARTFEKSQASAEIESYGQRPWIYAPIATDDAARTQEISNELDLRKIPAITATLDELSSVMLDVEVGDIVNFEYAARSVDTTLRVIGIGETDPRSGNPRQIELESHEGYFADTDTEPVPTFPVGATGAAPQQILEWNPIPPLSIYLDDTGNFSGTVLDDLDEYLNNPTGATITYSIPSTSNAINSASLNATQDLSVSVTGVVGNSLNENIVIRASGMVGGMVRTVEFTIQVDLVVQAGGGQGDTGPKGDTGSSGLASTVPGPQGDTGADSTVAGPKGDTGSSGLASTVPGPQGDTGADSTVAGPKGDTGSSGLASTVPGPQGDTGADSTVAGPKGDTGSSGLASTVPGPQGDTGADSTVAGPKGDTGSSGLASTVPGPQGDTGADSTVAGPKGDTGSSGLASTVPGPQGDTGADSTVAGPKGDTGSSGLASTVPGPQGDTGADSTVAGPKGDTGSSGLASTVPGPQGDTGADSTVAGPKGDTGSSGLASTVPGPQGDTGADSTVAGPQGDTGVQGDTGSNAELDFNILAGHFQEDSTMLAGSLTFDFDNQVIKVGTSGVSGDDS